MRGRDRGMERKREGLSIRASPPLSIPLSLLLSFNLFLFADKQSNFSGGFLFGFGLSGLGTENENPSLLMLASIDSANAYTRNDLTAFCFSRWQNEAAVPAKLA